MNIVIVGNGKMGFSLSRQLSKEGHDVLIIDHNAHTLEKTGNVLDVACLAGNGVNSDVQIEAGVPGADLLIAVTSNDEINIISCLIARKLGARHTIARVRNPEHARNLSLLREELGLSMTVNPEFEAANEICRVLRTPTALKVDYFNKGKVELVEIRVGPDSLLHGQPLHSLKAKFRANVLVCAVQRKGEVFIPDGSFVLESGDTISVTASPRDIGAFFKALGIPGQRIKAVMIVGGGRISYYLARQLIDMGVSVKIIEIKRERCNELAALLPKAMIIHGDGSDQEILHEENLSGTDALVALTGLDEENVVISIYATLQKVGKVVAKINHINLAGLLEKTGIDCTVTPHLISANQVVRYVRAMQNSLGSSVESMTQLIGGQAEALEFRVKKNFIGCGVPLRDIKLKKNLLIACIVRDQKVIFPGGNDSIRAGDSVIVITTITALEELNDILE